VECHMFSNNDIFVASKVLEWAIQYLSSPNTQMRRTDDGPAEPICPFVKASLDAGSFYVDVRREINGQSPDAISQLMLTYRDLLQTVPPFKRSEQNRKAIVVVFPEIPPQEASILDHVHSKLKTSFVHEGLMLTQCYSGCDMRSMRNPTLPVYDAPYPLMAVRKMAIHDVLFVGEDEEWFSAFYLRFGTRFRDPKTLHDYEQPLLEAFNRAKARFIK
jgi:hypothetical protein